MARRYPTFFPQRVNMRVPNMAYAGAAEGNDIVTADLGAPLAFDTIATAGTFLTLQSINAAGSTNVFNAAYVGSDAQMGRWGRCMQVVASGAATSTVTITGRDYLGSRMTETLTLNGAVAVLGQKAFRWVDSIAWAATAATTINVGISNGFGLPYKIKAMVSEVKNGTITANAGAVAAALATGTPSTAITADVRGRYTPATVVPNGTNTFEVRYVADTSNLHGNAQFA